jgi:hypothetical protein
MCALLLGLCVLLYLVLSWRTRHCSGNVSVAGHPHMAKQTGQAINRFDILHLVSMGAQPGPQPQDLRHHRASAAPHFTHTIYVHTQPSAHDLQPIQLDDYHPARPPPRRNLSQLGRELRAMLKFQFPRLNNEAIGFGLA